MIKRLIASVAMVGLLVAMMGALNFYTALKSKGFERGADNLQNFSCEPKQIQKLQTEVEQQWSVAQETFKKRDFYKTYQEVAQVGTLLAVALEHHGYKEVSPGLTLRAWADQQQEVYKEFLEDEFETVVTEFKAGQMGMEEMKEIRNLIDQVNFYQLRSRASDITEEIGEARSRIANKWIRIQFTEGYGGGEHSTPREALKGYKSIIFKALGKDWEDPYGFKLVVGQPFSSVEENATWKTLLVTITEKHSRYTEQHSGNMGAAFTLPESLEIKFESKSGRNEHSLEGLGLTAPTSWDRIETIQVAGAPPESISFSVDRGQKLAELDLSATENSYASASRSAFVNGLIKATQNLPEFDLYPDVDTDNISIVVDNKLDREKVQMLSLLDPDRLAVELKTHMQTTDIELGAELMRLVIDLDMQEYGDFVASHIAFVDLQRRRAIFDSLERRLEYANYKPAIAIISNLEESLPLYVYRALEKGLADAKVQEAVLTKISDTRSKQRAELASLWVKNAPLDQAYVHLDAWLLDPDIRLNVATFSALAERDPKQALAAANKNFEKFAKILQRDTLERVAYFINTQRIAASEAAPALELTRKAFALNDKKMINTNFHMLLRAITVIPQGWELVAELATKETNSDEKSFWQELLSKRPAVSEDVR